VQSDTDIKAGFRGKLLLDFLSASRARDVSFEFGCHEQEEWFILKAGRSRLRLPFLPPDDFAFTFPKTEGIPSIECKGEFIDALRKCSLSMGDDPGYAWRMGITLEFVGRYIQFYSSDNVSATTTRCTFKTKDALEDVVLPPRFVASILSRSIVPTLYFGEGWVQAKYEDGLDIFSKTAAEVNLDAYTSMLAITEVNASYPIPEGMDSSIDRALVILGDVDRVTDFSVEKGKLRLYSESALGEVKDTLKLPGHESVSVRVDPKAVKRALVYGEEFCIVPNRYIRFEGENFTHLVTVIFEEE
jgi:DNA polymerase III sliding clamp (beta) subunit (PCNA family)